MIPSPSALVVLVVDDEPQMLDLARRQLGNWGFEVITAPDGESAIHVLGKQRVDVVMVDLRMPKVDGIGVLRAIRDVAPDCRAILMTGYATDENRLEAVKLGAMDYLPKPLDWAYLRQRLESVREDFDRRRNIASAEEEMAQRLEFAGLIGRGPVMNDLFELIRRLAPYTRAALITGETGVGKDLVARAMHRLGPRRDRQLLAINCSAIVETLFESELFGHVRGAFTGASDTKVGLLEQADGGSVLLDEIGELPLAMQAKLLRVLELGEIYRVGSAEVRKVNVNVLAATNRDLEADVAAGRFRADLYYRLNVVEIHVPPLRERREDIPYLTSMFVRECRERLQKPIVGVTPSVERSLMAAAWPGNVRQLRNVIERAAILCEGEYITDREIKLGLRQRPSAPEPPSSPRGNVVGVEPADASLERVKLDYIRRVVAEAGGNRGLASQMLGISQRTITRLLKKT